MLNAEETSRHKPEPDPYLLAMKRLGVSVNRTVVFEDFDVGASVAMAADIPIIAYRHAFNERHVFENVVA